MDAFQLVTITSKEPVVHNTTNKDLCMLDRGNPGSMSAAPCRPLEVYLSGLVILLLNCKAVFYCLHVILMESYLGKVETGSPGYFHSAHFYKGKQRS